MATVPREGSCFACGASPIMRVDKGRRHFEDQVQSFSKITQELNFSNRISIFWPLGDPCAECYKDVREVWDLKEEILAIQRDMKQVLERVASRKGTKGPFGRGLGRKMGGVHPASDKKGPSASASSSPVSKRCRREESTETRSRVHLSSDSYQQDEDESNSSPVVVKEEHDYEDEGDPLEIIPEDIFGPVNDGEEDLSDEELSDRDHDNDGDPDYAPATASTSSPAPSGIPGKGRKLTEPPPIPPQDQFVISISQTSHGKPMLTVNGYAYRFHTAGAVGKIRWACIKQKPNAPCKCSVHTTSDLSNPLVLHVQGNHIHPPEDALSLELRDIKAHIISEALKNPEEKITDIVERNLGNMSEQGRIFIQKNIKSLTRSLKREKSKLMKDQASAEESGRQIPDSSSSLNNHGNNDQRERSADSNSSKLLFLNL